jgi:hypothetical protein
MRDRYGGGGVSAMSRERKAKQWINYGSLLKGKFSKLIITL